MADYVNKSVPKNQTDPSSFLSFFSGAKKLFTHKADG